MNAMEHDRKKRSFHCLWQYNLNVVCGEATAKNEINFPLWQICSLFNEFFFSNLFAYPFKKVLPELVLEIKKN